MDAFSLDFPEIETLFLSSTYDLNSLNSNLNSFLFPDFLQFFLGLSHFGNCNIDSLYLAYSTLVKIVVIHNYVSPRSSCLNCKCFRLFFIVVSDH